MWNMTSPDGKIQVIRHQSEMPGAPRQFVGSIEIPEWSFDVTKRTFYDPIAFSDNSRFLAVAEHLVREIPWDSGYSRVIVFDFAKQKEWIVHVEEQGSIEWLRWTIDSLRIGVISPPNGREEHVWKPRDFDAPSRKKKFGLHLSKQGKAGE
jgi:hypothetical protein